MNRAPAVGDLVRLPAFAGALPFRVLAVAPLRIDGWVRIDGYEILPDDRQHLAVHDVPVVQLRRLPDPLWPAACSGDAPAGACG